MNNSTDSCYKKWHSFSLQIFSSENIRAEFLKLRELVKEEHFGENSGIIFSSPP